MLPIIDYLTGLKESHYRVRDINLFLRRHKEYNPKGRNETEAQAKEVDKAIQQMCLINHFIQEEDHASAIFNMIKKGDL